MYITSWDEFSQRAKALYAANPLRARYCIRYNDSGSKMVVKVTDDSKVSSLGKLARRKLQCFLGSHCGLRCAGQWSLC